MAEQKAKKRRKTDQFDHANPFEKGITPDEIELRFDNGKSLFVSKGFLIYSSPVFDRMFSSEFREKTDNVVMMREKSFLNFQDMLLHMHPGRRKPIEARHARSIFEMSNEYQIPAVVDHCEEVLAKLIEDLPMSYEWDGKTESNSNNIKRTLDLLMFGHLYERDKIIKSACDNLSRVPLKEFNKFSTYKKLPESCKIAILQSRITRCDDDKFYKLKKNTCNEQEKVFTTESSVQTDPVQQPARSNPAMSQHMPPNIRPPFQIPNGMNHIQRPLNMGSMQRPPAPVMN